MEAVLAQREWLAAGQFSVADILMTDVLRVPKVMAAGSFPAIRSYVDRAALPAFKRAYDGRWHILQRAVSQRQSVAERNAKLG
jgi:glutathione S-transferase